MENPKNNITGRSPRGRQCPRNRDAPLEPASYPKLEAPYRLHLPVVRAVEIRFPCPDMGMAHQCLNCPEIISFIQQDRSKRMPHHMGMDSLLDQGLARHGFDEAINCFGGKFPFLIGTMFAEGAEQGVSRI
jgi:hypothetical protein